MSNKKKIGIIIAVILAFLLTTTTVLLVVFIPKTHSTHTLTEQDYNYELGKYVGTCSQSGCKEEVVIDAGSKEYPYLIKDDGTALSALGFVKTKQTGEDAVTDKLHLKLVGDVVIGSDKKEEDVKSIEHFVVEKEMNVELDLNGHSILDKTQKTIDNFGTLTIVDCSGGQNGFVDAYAYRASAVVNEKGGTFTLNSGRLYRSTKGDDPDSEGFISHYVLTNYGKATINGGKIHAIDGCYWGYPEDNTGEKWGLNTCSSLIANGWSDEAGHGNQNGEFPNDGLLKDGGDAPVLRDPTNDSSVYAELIINGGEFEGGKVVLKNDYFSKATINGGKFSTGNENGRKWDPREEDGVGLEYKQEGIFNVVKDSELTINDGEFKITNKGEYAIKNAGTVNVNGGKFTVEDCKNVIKAESGSTTTVSSDATLTGNITTEDEVTGDGSESVTGNFTEDNFTTSAAE